MAFRLFKKKDGSPSGFAKALKGVGKTVLSVGVGAASSFIPGGSKVGQALSKITDKVSKATKGQVNLAGLKPRPNDTIGSIFNRAKSGVGGAVAGFESASNEQPYEDSSLSPVEQGFAKIKTSSVATKLLLFGAVGAGVYFLLKQTKIIK